MSACHKPFDMSSFLVMADFKLTYFLSIKVLPYLVLISVNWISDSTAQAGQCLRDKTYECVDWDVVTPQWLRFDQYEVSNDKNIRKLIRFPPDERRYSFTASNQELIVLSSEKQQLFPSASKLLQKSKSPKLSDYAVKRQYEYQPLLSKGIAARHKFAEGLHIRWRHIGASDEIMVAILYMPIGWPMYLLVMFIICICFAPLFGAVLVHSSFRLYTVYKYILWTPIKVLLRWIIIKWQMSNIYWQQLIAPAHFLEPRISWKLPFFLRDDDLEDLPPELVYKPPINKIDYTMYILTEEDYDEMDLGLDEMEYIDDLLQFRDTHPKVVARLLKHRLGAEKFYCYFDEDILSDESDEEEEEAPSAEKSLNPEDVAAAEERERAADEYEYKRLLQTDEPWMHEEYDRTFTGPGYALEEIRKRRQIIQQLKEQIKYLHAVGEKEALFRSNYAEVSPAERQKAQHKARKLIEKYVRFSKITKERIAEIEPSERTQTLHNPALSKYLPLVDEMSHYNHRLNLKHEKQTDPARRKLQLDIFGGP